jgi:uncharacterized protein YyaL (SSP411 family)
MAEKGFAAFGRTLAGSPTAAPLMLSALDFYLDRPKEIVLVAPASAAEVAPFLDKIRSRFLPNRILVVAAGPGDRERLERLIPLLRERQALDGRPTAFVCEGRVCKLPTADPEEFARQIAEVVPYAGAAPAR